MATQTRADKALEDLGYKLSFAGKRYYEELDKAEKEITNGNLRFATKAQSALQAIREMKKIVDTLHSQRARNFY